MKDWYWIRCFVFLLIAITSARAQDGYIHGLPHLAYWQVGNETETVIVLHGGPAVQHDYLRPEFDDLQEVAKVIYYDQRGCGQSGLFEDNYTWIDHVNDLKRIIDAVSKKNKVTLAGSSWGSILALLYTYYHPEDINGLILSGTVNWVGEGVLEKDYQGGTYRHLELCSEIRQLSENRLLYPDGDFLNPKIVPISKEYEIFWGGPNLQTKHSLATAPVFDSLKKIQVPVLIFNGDREPCTTEIDWGNRYLEILPNSELYTIWGACHDPWFVNPSEFFGKSRKFLKLLNAHKGQG